MSEPGRCESCGDACLGTHLIDYQDGGRAFLVCEDCALTQAEALDVTVTWVGLQIPEGSS